MPEDEHLLFQLLENGPGGGTLPVRVLTLQPCHHKSTIDEEIKTTMLVATQ